MQHLARILLPLLWFGLTAQTVPPRSCQEMQTFIDAQVAEPIDPEVLLGLGPHFSPRVLADLLELGHAGPFRRRLAAYGAFGLTRYVESLRRIQATPVPDDEEGKIAHAVGVLALGADIDTATVASAVESPVLKHRRGVTWVLSRMKHNRARQLLSVGLEDTDLQVRLMAAEALVRYRYRKATQVLLDIVRSGDRPAQERAAEALIRVGYPFRPADLRRLNPNLAARAYARRNGRRSSRSRLKRQVVERDDGLRAGIMAVVAGNRDVTSEWVDDVCGEWSDRFGELGVGELAMTTALLGDEEAINQVGVLEGDALTAAVRVFLAFSEIPRIKSRIDPMTVGRVAQRLEGVWPRWSDGDQAAYLRGMATIDAPTGVALARRALAPVATSSTGPPAGSSRWVTAAAEILRRYGNAEDAVVLAAIVRPPSVPEHGPVLAAAARLCRLEGE